MSEEQKTPENGEAKEKDTAAEGKKGGKLSGFFKKMGQKLDDATYDARLASDFEKRSEGYRVYTGTGVFSPNPEIFVEEHLDGDEKYVVMYGTDDNVKAGCLIKKDEGKEVYHIKEVAPATLTIEFEGKTNEKPATKIVLGDVAEKVDVIKVEDEFYLK